MPRTMSHHSRRWAALALAVAPVLSLTLAVAPARAGAQPPDFLPANQTTLVTVGYDGKPADAGSERLSLDGDGRLVVFASEATNLVRRPGNGKAHIYLRDLAAGRTSLVDVGPHGELADQSSWDPMISQNGRYVVFFSDATNLASGGGLAHIYLRDLWAGTTTMIDVDNDGHPADRDSIQAQLSPDGRAVVFMSRSTNLAPGRTGDTWNVFLRDLDTKRTSLISAGMNGAKADGLSYGSSIDRSHRWVSFASLADNLVPGDTNKVGDVFLRDMWTGRIQRVSVSDSGAQGDDLAVGSSISADGRYVGFASHAKNLRSGLSTSDSHAYVRDVVAGRTISADSNAKGQVGNAGATWTAMSGDGRSVLFQSQAGNLLAAAPVSRWNVYRRDLSTGALTLVSTTPSGGEPNGENWWPTASGDGRVVGFLSFASNVRPGDTNGVSDIYVKRASTAGADGPLPAATPADPAPANRSQELASTARQSCGSGDVVVSGGSYVVVPYLNYYAIFTGDASKAAWTGAVPATADSVTLKDVWRIDFFGDGFGVTGLPAGATTTGDGGSLEVDWTTTAKNGWNAQHTADSLQFMPRSYFGQIYRIRHTVTATFTFGTSTCTVTTEARSYVW